jgi:8-oxo-dGTP diphosphatase
MMSQSTGLNPHISVDCVIFGFDGDQLRVLLIERTEGKTDGSVSALEGDDGVMYDSIGTNEDKAIEIEGISKSSDRNTSDRYKPKEIERKDNNQEQGRYKLPGDLIRLKEDLDFAAARVLSDLTGLKDIFLRQFALFGDPGRIPENDDRKWLERTSGLKISRVVTAAYFSLINIDKSKSENENTHHASWQSIGALPPLIFDHHEIILAGLHHLRKEIRFEPICFELLPGKFTIRQIQNLYEAILGEKLDNRNFRKKLLKATYIEPLQEKQKGVAHKPAKFYRFNRDKYEETRKNLLYYNF